MGIQFGRAATVTGPMLACGIQSQQQQQQQQQQGRQPAWQRELAGVQGGSGFTPAQGKPLLVQDVWNSRLFLAGCGR
jgi:hypothetical protein